MSARDARLQGVGDGVWLVANQIQPSNSYICATGDPGDCFLVDPGTDPEAIEGALSELGLKPSRIFCTHGHFDHAGGAAYFQERYGIPCLLHRDDLRTLRGSNFLLMAFKLPFVMTQPTTEPLDGFSVLLGERSMRAVPAPGHTPGSCILQYGKNLFTGDTLYTYGIGLSKLPGGNSEQLKATLLGLWNTFPEDAHVFPGHGEPGTLARIKAENRPLLDFLGLTGSIGGGA